MEKIDVGDKVFVAWGLDELPATVREIRGLPHHPFALVDVEIPSTGGDSVDIESVSVPLDALRLRTWTAPDPLTGNRSEILSVIESP